MGWGGERRCKRHFIQKAGNLCNIIVLAVLVQALISRCSANIAYFFANYFIQGGLACKIVVYN